MDPDEAAAPPLSPAADSTPADWGLAFTLRTAEIPFAVENDSVSSVVPFMFYEGKYFFLRGISGGGHLWQNEATELNLLARGRFVDIPDDYQNLIQGDTVDVGAQVRHDIGDYWLEGEALTDEDSRWHLNGRFGTSWSMQDLVLVTSLNLRYLSSRFTERYYALEPLTGDSAGSAWQLSPSITGRYHLFSDLYLIGGARYTFNSSGISGLPAVDTNGQYEFLLGLGVFQDSGDPQFLGYPSSSSRSSKALSIPPYLRFAYGEATPSDLGEIFVFDTKKDEYENRLASVFYGHPLTDSVFGAPIDLYLTPGFVSHQSSEVQSRTEEYVLAIKAYYTIKWPTRWRVGVAEGLSWIESITYIEQQEMDRKEYRPSQLMNYLDFSVDVNIGDLFASKFLAPLWLGYSIHHRSSIFESASQFGRIWGGSNYQTGYLQWDLL